MSEESSSQNPPLSDNGPHPGARLAWDFLKSLPTSKINEYRRKFVAEAIKGDVWAQACIDTLNCFQGGHPLSERDLMGTVLIIMQMEKVTAN